ncbi:oligosaccharyl transferase subunit ost3/OST6 [Malassezia nana]|uniref:Oligosaccharyl transferase subunit ost3/OST6 n=1 Tax=Malassezia nana TaxID=180528 RepID=A0AAF0EMT2_9BASI|nr:oligosaccharyl transferase subunit ost3/OST6 [Malassezia nana]
MRLSASLVYALTVLATLFLTLVSAEKSGDYFLNLAKSSSDGVLKLNSDLFKDLMSAHRDYDVFILYTALDSRFRCVACQMVDQPFSEVARGLRSGKHRTKLLMAKADADQNMDVFRMLGMNHAPAMRYYKPSDGAMDRSSEYDAVIQGFGSDDIAEFLGGKLNITIKPKAPLFTPLRMFYLFSSIICLAAFSYVGSQFSLKNGIRSVAMVISLGLVFMFTSGYMWTRIRSAPFMLQGASGPKLFADGFQSQTGIESSLLIANNAGLTLCLLLLIVVSPSIKSPMLQRLVALVGLIGFIALFSLLIKFFTFKHGGYPFRLFL